MHLNMFFLGGDSCKIYFLNLNPHLLTNQTDRFDHFVISAIADLYSTSSNYKVNLEIHKV